ncbi:MAG: class I SAM-dependent methyltransferase [Candidatus Competibacter sp.]|nr:class I SAM-dependent methyltransferase [Candidatus Competibacter sp.]
MAYFMEEHLDMPLRDALAIIQDRIMNQTTYFGVKALKNPFDHWVYQELIHANRPDVIIEIGNANGGSTLSLAHLCDLLGKGRVIAIDISHQGIPERVKKHPRIALIEGDACQHFAGVARSIAAGERVMIIEDSSHTYQNTLDVLRTYSVLLKPGDYFIVEDSICHHGLEVGPKPGPYEAIETFLEQNRNFVSDRDRESFLITWNPKGYLKCIGSGENRAA